MLIALILGYLFLGGSKDAVDLGRFYTDHAKSLIKAEIADPERRKAALESAEGAKKAVEETAKQMEKNGKRMKKLFEDYSSTPGEWSAAIEEGLAAEQPPFNQFVSARQAMLHSITPQEWTAIIAAAARKDESEAAKSDKKGL